MKRGPWPANLVLDAPSSRHGYNNRGGTPSRTGEMPMSGRKPTLNRFPLFGLFAYRAARKTGYPEEDAQLLGFSTALLYAIYKAKAQAKKEKPELEAIKERPEEEKRAKTTTIEFGGQEFTVIPGKGKRLKQTVVGHAVHDPEDYDAEIEAKFPAGWHDRLAKAFDTYLDAHSPEERDHLFDLYKAWRDACKAGFNRVQPGKTAGLAERTRRELNYRSREQLPGYRRLGADLRRGPVRLFLLPDEPEVRTRTRSRSLNPIPQRASRTVRCPDTERTFAIRSVPERNPTGKAG